MSCIKLIGEAETKGLFGSAAVIWKFAGTYTRETWGLVAVRVFQ